MQKKTKDSYYSMYLMSAREKFRGIFTKCRSACIEELQKTYPESSAAFNSIIKSIKQKNEKAEEWFDLLRNDDCSKLLKAKQFRSA